MSHYLRDLIICNLPDKAPRELLVEPAVGIKHSTFRSTERAAEEAAKSQIEVTTTSTGRAHVKDCFMKRCAEATQRGNILMWAAINSRFTPWVRAQESSLIALLASIDLS